MLGDGDESRVKVDVELMVRGLEVVLLGMDMRSSDVMISSASMSSRGMRNIWRPTRLGM